MSSHPARRNRRAATVGIWLFTALCAWTVGCVYDADDRCSPGQVVISHDRCACAPGTVAVDGICQPCPEFEVEQNGACVCEEGYVRSDDGSLCVLEEEGLYAPCASDEDCVSALFSHCQPDALGDYCTQAGCVSSDECFAGFACDTAASPSYCKRPPVGQGEPCASQDDCAGYEASYCEMVQGHVCLVSGCDTDPSVECFIGWECCHAGEAFGFPTLCSPEGSCPQ